VNLKDIPAKYYILALVLAALVGYFKFRPDPPAVTDTAAVKAENRGSISVGETPTPLPTNFKPKPGDKIVTVEVPPDTLPRTIKILVPVDAPVFVLSDSGKVDPTVRVSYIAYRNPWVDLKFHVLGGVGVNEHLEPTISAGVTFITMVDYVRLGILADRFGLGLGGGVELWREWNVTGKWNLLNWHDRKTVVTVGIGYRI